MTTVESWLSVALLATAFWAWQFLLPRAKRERDAFAVACSVLAVVVALLGWLLIGAAVHSR